MGLTKVFFQQKSFNSIEKLRTSIVADAAITVQTFWRGISCRRAYLIRKGLISKSDGSRRERGLAACRIQRLARRYIWATTKSRREVGGWMGHCPVTIGLINYTGVLQKERNAP